jgi:hypothetical protein
MMYSITMKQHIFMSAVVAKMRLLTMTSKLYEHVVRIEA